MPLIDSVTLLEIADRCAYQYGLLATSFENMSPTGTGVWGADAEYYWQYVTATDDPDVEIPLLATYYNTDYNFSLSGTIRAGASQLLGIITTMDNHFVRVGSTNSWDSVLRSYDEQVSDYTNQVYYLAKGQYLLSNNVFSMTEDTFGDWQTGDTFTDGIDYGDGSWTNRADGSNFAPTQFKAVVTAGTATSLVLKVYALEAGATSATEINTTAISGGAGTEVNIGTSGDIFVDVTNIEEVSGSSLGATIEIQNIQERTVEP